MNRKSKEEAFKEITELMKKEDSGNLFFKKRSDIYNKVIHANNTGSGGEYDELMAVTKALRLRDEGVPEDKVFKRLLEDFDFIENTTVKGLSWQYKELYEELIKEYGKPKSLDPDLVSKTYNKNKKIHWLNLIIGTVFVVALILIFTFLR